MATTEKKKSGFEIYDHFRKAMIEGSENKQLFILTCKDELIARVAFVQVAAENNGADVTCFVHVTGTLMVIGYASLDEPGPLELYTRAFIDAVSSFQSDIERSVHHDDLRTHQVNFFSAGKMCAADNSETWSEAMNKLNRDYSIRNMF